MSAMLEVRDLTVAYGKIKAVKGISFDVEQGEVVTLIGTNGAGKTTTLRTISGLLRPSGGSITFKGKDLSTVPAHDIVQLGLAHSPRSADLPPAECRGEPPARGVRPQGQGDLQRPPGGLRAVPDPRGAAGPTRRDVLGW